MINEALNKIISGSNLEETMTIEVFDEILSGLADNATASSFITALKMKTETPQELYEAIVAARNSVKKIGFDYKTENLIENINFGAPKNIIDISFALDIICAACGLGAVKYSFNSPFYKNNSFETLSALGINFSDKNSLFKNEFEKLNFAYVELGIDEPYYKYSSQITKKLPFFNIFNTLDKMLNPYCAKNQLIGVNKKEDVEKFANITLKLNNLNTIIISGADNLPFISPNGETYIAEAWKDKVFTYALTPDLLGFNEYSFDNLKCDNVEYNVQILLDVFSNKTKDAPYQTIIMNAAMALYIAKKADSILEGLELAKKTIDDGLALYKLEQIKNTFIE